MPTEGYTHAALIKLSTVHRTQYKYFPQAATELDTLYIRIKVCVVEFFLGVMYYCILFHMSVLYLMSYVTHSLTGHYP